MSEGVTLERLEVELAEVCGQLNVLHARLVSLTAAGLGAKAWEHWGAHTPAQWLAWKAGLSRGQARLIVRLAERQVELPVTMEAFAAGELSLDQVAPIAQRVPAWAEGEVCELAKKATITQLRTVVSKYPFDPAPAKPKPARDPYVRLASEDDGMWRLSGLLDADHGIELDKALAEARDALYSKVDGPASNVDALIEVARRSLDAVTSTARRDRYRMHVHVDAASGEATDEFGAHLPEWIRRLIGCDTATGVVWTMNGKPFATSDPKAAIPAAIRRHVSRRDRRCRVPGCHGRVRDLHHITHREDGGENTVENLCGLCPRHHRMHHRGLLHIEGNAEDPDGLVFTNQHGVRLKPPPIAQPPTTPLPQPARQYRHALRETIEHACVHFGHAPADTG